MKTTDPDTMLLKQAIRQITADAKLSKQLRKLPHNRAAAYQQKTAADLSKLPWSAGRILCLVRSQQNGHINDHRYKPQTDDKALWLGYQAKWLDDNLIRMPDDLYEAAKRCLAKVQWRLERPPQMHCRHKADFVHTGARCCYCAEPADPSTICSAPSDPVSVF